MFNKYTEVHPWSIIEEGWDPSLHPGSESLFSIGNGKMGQRANFEERYSGESLQGSYVAGVYYPDKTRVGWWKNGYPEYFAKVLNSTNWIGINVSVDGEDVDLATAKSVGNFRRELDMKQGVLRRTCEVELNNGKRIAITAERFTSIAQDEIGALSYRITLLEGSGTVCLTPYVDGDVHNEDSNYDEKFWIPKGHGSESGAFYVVNETKKTGFVVAAAMHNTATVNGKALSSCCQSTREDYVEQCFEAELGPGEDITLQKVVAVLSSMNHPVDQLAQLSGACAKEASDQGYDALRNAHVAAWAHKWESSDIVIEGDDEAQQGIRFNIFHLNQTFTGVDARLNIGPKGFTGEKYGGSTYWDTEAYCLPFYLATAQPEVAKNLVLYRYKHLDKAIANAEKLGFTNGAALYPMVTMNGEECHNEWEITFEEIHRNAAIAFGVYDYVRHTNDTSIYGISGFEVLLAISRFWVQRVNWSQAKNAYVMLGVTGPNEYENNVNNNWYTNRMAAWTLEYTLEVMEWLQQNDPARWEQLTAVTRFNEAEEVAKMKDVIANMYYPYNEELGLFMQQDGFMDKEQLNAADLPNEERPINQFWSWDRILRSIFIKQADTLQGMYFLNHLYSDEMVRKHFDFYEPKTVHESSLSPCVHSILAAQLGYEEKAYEMYLRTSRLDIDDYNKEVHEGLHITSMGGTWMSVVQGFGGMRILKDAAGAYNLHFNPRLPKGWNALRFTMLWRGSLLAVNIEHGTINVEVLEGNNIELYINDVMHTASRGEILKA